MIARQKQVIAHGFRIEQIALPIGAYGLLRVAARLCAPGQDGQRTQLQAG